jgi:hypothetical protein
VINCKPKAYRLGGGAGALNPGVAVFRVILTLVLLGGTIQAQTTAVLAAPEARPTCSIKWITPSSWVAANSEKHGTRVVDRENDHRIVIDSDGVLASSDPISEDLKKLFQHIEQKGKHRLVLFIHGGLTTLDSANQNAQIRGPEIAHDDTDAYPIFLNWEAGLWTSYGRHLAYERNGTSYRGTPSAWYAVAITPLVFLSDVGRSVANHSMNTVLNFSKVLENNDYWYQNRPATFVTKNKFLETLREFSKHPENSQKDDSFFHAGLCYDPLPHRPPFELYLGPDITAVDVGQFALGSTTIPLQLATEPVVDTIGTPAWKNMLRRTRTMFFPAENFITTNGNLTENLSATAPPPQITHGAAYQFFDQLNAFLKTHPDYYLDVFAHSMGAIVMNEAYRNFPDLRVRKLVYMAAACTIRDFLVGPGKDLERNHTEFYNLCLHPRRELDEVEGYGVPARGSLLTWIDEFFESPASFGDRTLGSFQNCVIAYRLLPQTSRIHLKAFGIARKDDPKGFLAGPQKHGDFGNFPFWKPCYWSTEVRPDQCYEWLK